ncbi:hypothetical protein AVEN_32879-1 [Araneus ventricosus]|uniref:Uncharacterized protein n=1 Tax=Araneus ventricosus TaxID=182803 RepID=A0A4Y2XCL1_ARAVE|nr:hypothetical protein AVEN_32879-1 [Araneus ventricosus]
MECDRYEISDKTATSFASAVLQGIGIVHEGKASHVEKKNFILNHPHTRLTCGLYREDAQRTPTLRRNKQNDTRESRGENTPAGYVLW